MHIHLHNVHCTYIDCAEKTTLIIFMNNLIYPIAQQFGTMNIVDTRY